MNGLRRSKLLVSVRSADETRTALAGGADFIDVKEPDRGPLGAADMSVIREVLAVVSGRTPVSAALGEWSDAGACEIPPGLDYVKWGMARQNDRDSRPVERIRRSHSSASPVLVAYADYGRAESPDPDWLAEAAIRFQFRAFLVDTAVKDGTTLLDWLDTSRLSRIRFRLADAGVAVALAGSLNETAIRTLAPLAPDWFAVRGAACVGGRSGIIDSARVGRLRAVIAQGSRATAS